MNDEIVFVEGPFLILKSIRPFATGFNIYRKTSQDENEFTKVNEEYHYFQTLESAREFLKKISNG